MQGSNGSVLYAKHAIDSETWHYGEVLLQGASLFGIAVHPRSLSEAYKDNCLDDLLYLKLCTGRDWDAMEVREYQWHGGVEFCVMHTYKLTILVPVGASVKVGKISAHPALRAHGAPTALFKYRMAQAPMEE